MSIEVKFMGGSMPLSTGADYKLQRGGAGLVFIRGFSKTEIPWADITDMAVEGSDAVARRVTVTRALATGIFALVLKKKSKQSMFMCLETAKGANVFELHVKDPMKAKAQLLGWRVS